MQYGVFKSVRSVGHVAPYGSLVLNMARLDYVSLAGSRVMLKTAKASRAGKNKLVLAGLQPTVQEVFDISGFTALFVVVDTIEEAKASLSENLS